MFESLECIFSPFIPCELNVFAYELGQRSTDFRVSLDPDANCPTKSEKATDIFHCLQWGPVEYLFHFYIFRSSTFNAAFLCYNDHLRLAYLHFLSRNSGTSMCETVQDTVNIESVFPNEPPDTRIGFQYFRIAIFVKVLITGSFDWEVINEDVCYMRDFIL